MERLWETKANDDERRAFGADCDRILYSSAFRRLTGVTQVVSASETELFHNRLTHSYKVAQVGARITHTIKSLMESDSEVGDEVQQHGGLDPRVVRAACFAHDLGHPPFGHVAEKELDQILCPTDKQNDPEIDPAYHLADGFEGNAQSFRIVTKLAFREENAVALDLTRATLRALLKYPWLRNEDLGNIDDMLAEKRKEKWGAYDSESAILNFARGTALNADEPQRLDQRQVDFHGREATELRTIEAQIMDWADDITYAIHDVEDFFRAGLIPLDQLKKDDRAFDMFLEAVWPSIDKQVGEQATTTNPGDENAITIENARNWMYGVRRNRFPGRPYTGRRSDREGLHTFASELIRGATEKLKITKGGLLLPGPQQFTVIEILKKMTKYYVIQRPGISSAQRGQSLLIRRLFKGLLNWAVDGKVFGTLQDIVADASAGKNAVGTGFEPELVDRILVEFREFPARFVDYLVVAFDHDGKIGCTEYYNPKTDRWIEYTPEQRLSRAIVDYIVSLTESQTVALDARLNGFPAESMLEKWISV